MNSELLAVSGAQSKTLFFTTMKVDHVEDLEVYQLAFLLQQRVFEVSKHFPREETYALSDQMRRAARSIGANIAEAWAKRHYVAHFRSKLTDADGEKNETLHWIRTAVACRYIDSQAADSLTSDYAIVGRKLGTMIRDADTWCQPASNRLPTSTVSLMTQR